MKSVRCVVRESHLLRLSLSLNEEWGFDIVELGMGDLAKAVSDKDLQEVRWHLFPFREDSFSSHFQDTDGIYRPKIHAAIAMGDEKFVKAAMERGAPTQIGNWNAAKEAALRGQSDTLTYLIRVRNQATVYQESVHGRQFGSIHHNLVSDTLLEGHSGTRGKMVRLLVGELGASLDDGYIPPLVAAILAGHKRAFGYLLDQGADSSISFMPDSDVREYFSNRRIKYHLPDVPQSLLEITYHRDQHEMFTILLEREPPKELLAPLLGIALYDQKAPYAQAILTCKSYDPSEHEPHGGFPIVLALKSNQDKQTDDERALQKDLLQKRPEIVWLGGDFLYRKTVRDETATKFFDSNLSLIGQIQKVADWLEEKGYIQNLPQDNHIQQFIGLARCLGLATRFVALFGPERQAEVYRAFSKDEYGVDDEGLNLGLALFARVMLRVERVDWRAEGEAVVRGGSTGIEDVEALLKYVNKYFVTASHLHHRENTFVNYELHEHDIMSRLALSILTENNFANFSWDRQISGKLFSKLIELGEIFKERKQTIERVLVSPPGRWPSPFKDQNGQVLEVIPIERGEGDDSQFSTLFDQNLKLRVHLTVDDVKNLGNNAMGNCMADQYNLDACQYEDLHFVSLEDQNGNVLGAAGIQVNKNRAEKHYRGEAITIQSGSSFHAAHVNPAAPNRQAAPPDFFSAIDWLSHKIEKGDIQVKKPEKQKKPPGQEERLDQCQIIPPMPLMQAENEREIYVAEVYDPNEEVSFNGNPHNQIDAHFLNMRRLVEATTGSKGRILFRPWKTREVFYERSGLMEYLNSLETS